VSATPEKNERERELPQLPEEFEGHLQERYYM
jgi:hypothetical protein